MTEFDENTIKEIFQLFHLTFTTTDNSERIAAEQKLKSYQASFKTDLLIILIKGLVDFTDIPGKFYLN